jgi:DNA-binding response OmpR family regulator
MKNSLLVFGTKNFNNSLNEIKEYLNFTLIFFKKDTFPHTNILEIKAVIVDSEICNDAETLTLINEIKNKPFLLLETQSRFKISNNKYIFNNKITLPLNLQDFIDKITNLIMSTKFSQNSSVQIKKYIIDKNEKKLKKGNLSIIITEREIQLIELLYFEKKPLTKKIILKQVWKYSEEANTHTIETHIYRLRKKIFDNFNDENFIINSKLGYSI